MHFSGDVPAHSFLKVSQLHGVLMVSEDLRESGAIEQNADLVILIYRPEVDDPRDHELKGIAEVNLAKHRNGETGQFKLAWIGGYTKFENLADEDLLTG